MAPSFTHEVPSLYTPKRIDAYLAQVLTGQFSRQEIKAAMDDGKVFLNGKLAKPKDVVKQGDRVTADLLARKIFEMTGEKIPLKILYEDEAMLVVEKPAGMVVHPGAGNKRGTLVHALLGRGSDLSSVGGKDRPGIVHRLDKDTSGILLVAKNNIAHRALQAQFASRSLFKTYTALVRGRVEFEQGHILEPIGHDPKIRRKMAVSRDEKAREAESYYKVLKRFRYATLVEVRIVTGRTHQIRVHMKHLGHPVAGDVMYGTGKAGDRLCLHASKLKFLHPESGKLMEFESPLPQDMMAVIQKAENETEL